MALATLKDPDSDFRTFNYDKDVSFAVEKVGSILDAADTNLRRFMERGSTLQGRWKCQSCRELRVRLAAEIAVRAQELRRAMGQECRSTVTQSVLFESGEQETASVASNSWSVRESGSLSCRRFDERLPSAYRAMRGLRRYHRVRGICTQATPDTRDQHPFVLANRKVITYLFPRGLRHFRIDRSLPGEKRKQSGSKPANLREAVPRSLWIYRVGL